MCCLDHTVAQALQLSPGRHRAFQNVNLGTDMVEYVLGDPLVGNKGIRTLQAIKRHDFVSVVRLQGILIVVTLGVYRGWLVIYDSNGHDLVWLLVLEWRCKILYNNVNTQTNGCFLVDQCIGHPYLRTVMLCKGESIYPAMR